MCGMMDDTTYGGGEDVSYEEDYTRGNLHSQVALSNNAWWLYGLHIGLCVEYSNSEAYAPHPTRSNAVTDASEAGETGEPPTTFLYKSDNVGQHNGTIYTRDITWARSDQEHFVSLHGGQRNGYLTALSSSACSLVPPTREISRHIRGRTLTNSACDTKAETLTRVLSGDYMVSLGSGDFLTANDAEEDFGSACTDGSDCRTFSFFSSVGDETASEQEMSNTSLLDTPPTARATDLYFPMPKLLHGIGKSQILDNCNEQCHSTAHTPPWLSLSELKGLRTSPRPEHAASARVAYDNESVRNVANDSQSLETLSGRKAGCRQKTAAASSLMYLAPVNPTVAPAPSFPITSSRPAIGPRSSSSQSSAGVDPCATEKRKRRKKKRRSRTKSLVAQAPVEKSLPRVQRGDGTSRHSCSPSTRSKPEPSAMENAFKRKPQVVCNGYPTLPPIYPQANHSGRFSPCMVSFPMPRRQRANEARSERNYSVFTDSLIPIPRAPGVGRTVRKGCVYLSLQPYHTDTEH